MSTIKSSAEDLTLNADGSGNDVIIQSNGSTKAIVTAEGNVGIGCTPDNKLTVQDSSYKIHLGVQSADPTIHFTDSSNSTNDGVLKFYKLKFKTDGGVTNMLLDNNGNLDIKVGNLIIGTAGKGIDFSAQTATSETGAASTSEVLDHYEEGTWTPTWTPNDSGTIVTNTTYSTGGYTRIGNVVHIWGRLYTNNVTSPTGLITISGLPFTVGAEGRNGAFHLFGLGALTGTLTGQPMLRLSEGTESGTLMDKVWDSTETAGVLADHFDNDVWGHFTFQYHV